MYGYYNMMRWNGLDWAFRFLFWGLIIFGILAIVRLASKDERFGHGHHDHHDHMDKTPLDILKYRYAKGEIDKKEFEEKKKDLSE